jgi:hypothetical protein
MVSSSITNCYNTASISGISTKASTYAGGICGHEESSSISNCYNAGDVSATGTSSTSSGAGGICGYNYNSSITNCFAANASVTFTGATGTANRIVGRINDPITLGNNHARADMLVNDQTVSSDAADGQEGADADKASFQSLDWLESPLGWDMDDDLSSNEVTYGDDAQIVYSSPAWAPAVEYTSSDNAIAEVVGDEIQIKSVGTVTIWATRAGTSSYASAKTGATLTINKAPLTVAVYDACVLMAMRIRRLASLMVNLRTAIMHRF